MELTVSMSAGKIAIKHDIREEISNNVDVKMMVNNEIFIDELAPYNHSLEEYTNARFQPVIDEYNVGKKNCRQIHGTYIDYFQEENEKLLEKARTNKEKGIDSTVRKPTKLAYEYVFQFGNHETNSALPMPGESEEQYQARIKENKEMMKALVDEFQEKYPHAKVLLATFHADEPNGTPHMHVIVQFEGEGYQRGLKRQISMSKALELDGFERSAKMGKGTERKDFAINRWQNDVKDNVMTPILQKHELNRLDLNEHRKHEPTHIFREKARKEAEELEEIRIESQAAEQSLKDTHTNLDTKISQKRKEHQNLQTKIIDKIKEKNTLQGECDKLAEGYVIVAEDLDKKKAEIEELNAKTVQYNELFTKAEDKLKEINEQIEEAEGQLKEKNDALEALSASIQPLQTQVDELKTTKTDLEGDIEVLKATSLSIDTAINNAMGQAESEANGIITEANEKAKTIKSDAKTKADEIIAEANETANSITQSAFQNSDVQALQKENAKLKTENKWLRSLIEGFHHKVDCFYADHKNEPFFGLLSDIIAGFNKEWNYGRGPVVRKNDLKPDISRN